MEKMIRTESSSLLSNANKIVEEYLRFIDVVNTSSETYKKGLKAFFSYLNDIGVQNPTRENIIDFKNILKSDGHSLSTVNTYLVSIRNFFKWTNYSGLYKDISLNVKGVKVPREHKKEALTNEQIDLVLRHAKDNREKAIFLLGLCCGLRANEICNVRLSDFVLKGGKTLLYVLGKARDGKVDYVVVDDGLYGFLKQYIQEYNVTDYLISSDYKNDGSKVTNKTIRYIVKQMFRRVGIDSELYSTHSLRHTFSNMAIMNGVDIRQIQQALRHQSLSTTMIYLHDLEARNNPCSKVVTNIVLGG